MIYILYDFKYCLQAKLHGLMKIQKFQSTSKLDPFAEKEEKKKPLLSWFCVLEYIRRSSALLLPLSPPSKERKAMENKEEKNAAPQTNVPPFFLNYFLFNQLKCFIGVRWYLSNKII